MGAATSSVQGFLPEQMVRLNGRHAFVHERVLAFIVHETQERGSVTFCKGDLAKRLGCCDRSVDRALTRLRREGDIVSTPVYGESGAQLGNTYRATKDGIKHAGIYERKMKLDLQRS